MPVELWHGAAEKQAAAVRWGFRWLHRWKRVGGGGGGFTLHILIMAKNLSIDFRRYPSTKEHP